MDGTQNPKPYTLRGRIVSLLPLSQYSVSVFGQGDTDVPNFWLLLQGLGFRVWGLGLGRSVVDSRFEM